MNQAPHTELRERYLQDCRETTEPWLWWECQVHDYLAWCQCTSELQWRPRTKYRRKPDTIKIGSMEVPAPLKVAPKEGATVWVTCPAAPKDPVSFVWSVGYIWGVNALNLGQLHDNEAACVTHGEALALVSGGKV